MKWTRSETLGLAAQNCTYCFGRGLRPSKRGHNSACLCVLRHIFRVCYARFCQVQDKEKHLSHVTLAKMPGTSRRPSYGRRDEEFAADFILVSRRHLDAEEMRVFKAHMLLGADWRLCCRQLGFSRGDFFHMVYRIMHKLGRAFAETAPYPLFPLSDYYESYCSVELGLACSLRELRRLNSRRDRPRPLVPPLRKAA
jgi:hypothetical protein